MMNIIEKANMEIIKLKNYEHKVKKLGDDAVLYLDNLNNDVVIKCICLETHKIIIMRNIDLRKFDDLISTFIKNKKVKKLRITITYFKQDEYNGLHINQYLNKLSHILKQYEIAYNKMILKENVINNYNSQDICFLSCKTGILHC